jgi:DNA-binding NarL/FixJ family response regulator
MVIMTFEESNARIIELLAKGKTVKEVAVDLNMNKRTIKARIDGLKRKHQSATITQLVLKVVMFNLSHIA